MKNQGGKKRKGPENISPTPCGTTPLKQPFSSHFLNHYSSLVILLWFFKEQLTSNTRSKSTDLATVEKGVFSKK